MNIFKKIVFYFILAFVGTPIWAQTMSDEQVLEYVRKSAEEGKDQRVIALELSRRGVTKQQAERVKKLYEESVNGKTVHQDSVLITDSRLRTPSKLSTTVLEENKKETDESKQIEIFGRNIFKTDNLTFEPSTNLPTPQNYILGPGDEIIIDIWGSSQKTIRTTISPDGTINLDKIGPVTLNGLTIGDANQYIKKILSKTYIGLKSQNSDLDIKLTLGNTRTIQVNVMGEVVQPGTYTLSSFASVFHALYRAGGVNEIGSLRHVKLMRRGRAVSNIDIYDFILNGTIKHDIRLEEGDVIIVPPYEVMVTISGNIMRSMKFEMKENETLAALLDFAGGFKADAYTRNLSVIRQNGKDYEVNIVKELDYSVYTMRNGDVVTVDAISDRFINKLEIKGAVLRPGIFQLNGQVNTVRTLVEAAEGIRGDAFTNRVLLQREDEDLTKSTISVNLQSILNGTSPDIILKKNDVLYVPSIHDLEERGDVTIMGEVSKPGNYGFSDNMTLEDLVIRAGGLREAASLVRVDVSRRIKDSKSTEFSDSIAKLYSFSLKDGFVITGEPGFILEPYDQVYVRKSPAYQVQQNVEISGQVLFPGIYSMNLREERLSDLLNKAGGITSKAYIKGARLMRKANESEKKRMEDVIHLMNRNYGTRVVDSLGIKVEEYYSVGINLEAAVQKPGGKDDIVLREGDKLEVPVMNNTVKINGAVMYPNTVAYIEGKPVKYYIEQAGGYGLNAKKTKKFIIYMNGQIATVGSGDRKVEPGAEIFVPSSTKRRMQFSEIMGYTSSFASLATMFATITNLIKN